MLLIVWGFMRSHEIQGAHFMSTPHFVVDCISVDFWMCFIAFHSWNLALSSSVRHLSTVNPNSASSSVSFFFCQASKRLSFFLKLVFFTVHVNPV